MPLATPANSGWLMRKLLIDGKLIHVLRNANIQLFVLDNAEIKYHNIRDVHHFTLNKANHRT